MSFNNSSSSSSNVSLVVPSPAISEVCLESSVGNIILTACSSTCVLLVPLYIFILYLGLQRWRRQRSVSAATASSHSDVFTYHMVVMELIGTLGSVLYCCGIYVKQMGVISVGRMMLSFVFPGQTLFHCLTCTERYLAVVHPITYLSLRTVGGVRIRNFSIVCVWLLSFGGMGVSQLPRPEILLIPFFSFLALFFVVTLFCSLAILRTLIRPRLREVGGNRESINPSKLRALYTIMAILGVQLVQIVGFLVCFGMYGSALIPIRDPCVLISVGSWFGLPSSLVLPLLYLHRAGKLVCCKC